MLAVPAVSIEENEVRLPFVVDYLVDADEPLNRRPAAAFVVRIKIDDPDDKPLRGRDDFRFSLCFPLRRPLLTTFRACPRIVDSAHCRS